MTTLGVTPWRSLFCALGSSICGQANIGYRTTEATVIRATPKTRSRAFSGTLLSFFMGSPVADLRAHQHTQPCARGRNRALVDEAILAYYLIPVRGAVVSFADLVCSSLRTP